MIWEIAVRSCSFRGYCFDLKVCSQLGRVPWSIIAKHTITINIRDLSCLFCIEIWRKHILTHTHFAKCFEWLHCKASTCTEVDMLFQQQSTTKDAGSPVCWCWSFFFLQWRRKFRKRRGRALANSMTTSNGLWISKASGWTPFLFPDDDQIYEMFSKSAIIDLALANAIINQRAKIWMFL